MFFGRLAEGGNTSSVARELGFNRVARYVWAHRAGIFAAEYADAKRQEAFGYGAKVRPGELPRLSMPRLPALSRRVLAKLRVDHSVPAVVGQADAVQEVPPVPVCVFKRILKERLTAARCQQDGGVDALGTHLLRDLEPLKCAEHAWRCGTKVGGETFCDAGAGDGHDRKSGTTGRRWGARGVAPGATWQHRRSIF